MYIPDKNPAVTFCRIISLGNIFWFSFVRILFRMIIITEIKIEIKLGNVSGLFNVENVIWLLGANFYYWVKMFKNTKAIEIRIYIYYD